MKTVDDLSIDELRIIVRQTQQVFTWVNNWGYKIPENEFLEEFSNALKINLPLEKID